jgi:hypothetical protein
MSDFASLLNKLQRAYARISEVERAAAQFPGDRYVLANLSSLRRDAETLNDLWIESAKHQEKEVCRKSVAPIKRRLPKPSVNRKSLKLSGWKQQP